MSVLDVIGQKLGALAGHLPDPRQAMLNLVNGPSATPMPSVIGKPSDMKVTYRTNPNFVPQAQASGDIGRNPDFAKKAMSPEVNSAILNAANEFKIPPSLMYDIGYSEGGFRPDAANTTPEGVLAGTPRGLYQFKPGTWNHDLVNYANMPNSSLKNWSTQGGAPDINDAIANARAAAYLIRFGQLGRWDASKSNWGRFYSDKELTPYYSQTPR